MLVLSRKVDERIRIGDDIIVTLIRINGDQVRLGIDAPRDVEVHREEVYDQIQAERRQRSQEQSHQQQNQGDTPS